MMVIMIESGELPDTGAAELVNEAMGGDRVDLVVGSSGNEETEAVKIEFFLRKFGQDIGTVGVEAEHLGGGNVRVVGVEQHHAMDVAVEGFGGEAGPCIGSGEKNTWHLLDRQAGCHSLESSK